MSNYSEKIARAKQQGLYKVADLLSGPVTHTISHLLEDVVKFEREMDLLCFADTARQLQINVTNGEWLINNFGEDPEDWAGQHVTLYVGTFEFGKNKEQRQGIRLKKPDGAAPKRSLKDDLGNDEIPY